MSALPPESGHLQCNCDVRFVPIADIVLRNRHVGFAPGRKSRAQGEAPDGPPGSAELTRTPINQAMPSSIMAALVATAKIGSGLRLKGSSAEARPKRAAWLVTRRRGSAAIRSELERCASAIMKVGTVSAMRRFRPRLASNSSTKPCGSPLSDTRRCCDLEYAARLGERAKRMSLAHRHHEIFLKKSARLEAWWHYAERKQRDVDVPLFELLQTPLPGLVLWAAALLRHQMKQPNVDMRCIECGRVQYRCHHRGH